MNSDQNNPNTGHVTVIPIRFADIDQLGHVNNANYLTYIESARIKYIIDVVGEELNWDENGIILARATVDFKVPLELSDEDVLIYIKCSRIGTKSFDLSYSILRTKDKLEVATGLTTLVCFNYKQNKTIEVPEAWKEKMTEYEK